MPLPNPALHLTPPAGLDGIAHWVVAVQVSCKFGRKRAHAVGPPSERIDHTRFIALLAQELPEVAAQIDEYTRGLLHVEMGTVGRATRAAAEDGDWDMVRRHLAFVERVHSGATPEVDNAVYASFMEMLPLWGEESDPPELRALLPVGLAGVLWDMEGREFEWPPVPRPR